LKLHPSGGFKIRETPHSFAEADRLEAGGFDPFNG
jgi:hypothetical protein